jgi:hypothetical protein
MPRFKVNGVLERNATEDLWKHTLSQIPTIFGRLAYLASLRSPNSGVYKHHGMTALFGRDESQRALRGSHDRVFLEWINLPLDQKSAELNRYLDEQEEPAAMVIDHWQRSRMYETLAPASARPPERQLFYSDLGALLAVLKNELAARDSDRGSSRPA